MYREMKTGNQTKVCQVIEKKTGATAKVIAVPAELIHFAGSAQKGVFLAQLIYWSDKGARNDGFIFKTRKEWTEETGLSRNQLERYTNEFEEKGFLETKLRKAHGSPTIHYRLDIEKLGSSISDYLAKRYTQKSHLEGEKIDNSLTEITPDNTHNITYREREPLKSNTIENGDSSLKFEDVSREFGTDVNTSFIDAAHVDENSTKILLPDNFSPSLDEKRRAIEIFPYKSPSYVTEKFIFNYCQPRGMRLSILEWHNKWWDWMNSERTTYGNEKLADEHIAIRCEAYETLGDTINKRCGYTFTIDDILRNAFDTFTRECIEIIVEEMIRYEDLARVGDYFYERDLYLANDDHKAQVDDELDELGLFVSVEPRNSVSEFGTSFQNA
jgi:hypothetical protein